MSVPIAVEHPTQKLDLPPEGDITLLEPAPFWRDHVMDPGLEEYEITKVNHQRALGNWPSGVYKSI